MSKKNGTHGHYDLEVSADGEGGGGNISNGVSRVSKLPRKKQIKGVTALEALQRRLGPEEFRSRAQLTEEQMAMLDGIAAGRAPRNSASILGAITLKTQYAYSRPKQEIELGGAVINFEICPPQPAPTEPEPPMIEIRPPVEPKGPIIRRKRDANAI